MTTVLLLGGSGFIGVHLAHQLCAMGVQVRVVTRSRERAKARLIVLPTVDVLVGDVHDPKQLTQLLGGVDAVINLIGVLHDVPKGALRRNHAELPRQLIAACQQVGVRRLLHMSALHASESGPSHYLRSKGEGERLVLAAQGLHTTVFRPSVVFGPGDHFLTLFAAMARRLPVLPLACPEARFQPVYVEDVARAFATFLGAPQSAGRAYDLCGPRVYTLRELVRFAAAQVGARPAIIGLPGALARVQAMLMQHLPGRLLTPDNLDSMRVDSVSDQAMPFDLVPTSMESVAPQFLGADNRRARLNRMQARQ